MGSVDVVVPSYQYGHLLGDCIRSVLAQDISDLRLLVIDNASTDNSVEVAQSFAAQDSRVEVVARRTNLGPHASFNEGIDWARGDYFLVLCADDLLTPAALQRATFVLDRHPNHHLAYGAALSVPSTDPLPIFDDVDRCGRWRFLTGAELLRQFCATGRNHVFGPTAVVRTSVQKRVGYYRKELTHTDDLEMWMRFCCHGGAAETDSVQGIARTHAVNQSASVPTIFAWELEFEAAFRSFFGKEGKDLECGRELLALALRSLAHRAYWGGFATLARGDRATAWDLLRFAWRVAPRTRFAPPVRYLLRRPDTARRIAHVLAEVKRTLLHSRAQASHRATEAQR